MSNETTQQNIVIVQDTPLVDSPVKDNVAPVVVEHGRDSAGKFVKGHPYIASKRGLFGGRKPNAAKNLVERQLHEVDISQIIGKLEQLCLEGDRAACEYLIDRRLGKPRQQLNVEGELAGTQIQIIEIRKDYGKERNESNRGSEAQLPARTDAEAQDGSNNGSNNSGV